MAQPPLAQWDDGRVLDELAALGPFFAVAAHPPGAAPAPPWRPVSELTTPSRALRERIASVRAILASRGGLTVAQVELRVAASAVHLGLAARLAAPALGAAVLRHPFDPRPAGLWWQDAPGGPVPLCVPLLTSRDTPPAKGASPPAEATPAEPGRPPRASAEPGRSSRASAESRPPACTPGQPGILPRLPPAAPDVSSHPPRPPVRPPAVPGHLSRPPDDPSEDPGRLSSLPVGPLDESGRPPRLPARAPAEPGRPSRPPLGSSEDPGPPGEWDLLLLDELLAPLAAAVARLVPVSRRVLWGNVASAVNAAAAQVARQRPDLAGGAWQAAARLFARPHLRDERDPPGPAFRRSSCCLFYRLAPGTPSAVCGDCVLAGRANPR